MLFCMSWICYYTCKQGNFFFFENNRQVMIDDLNQYVDDTF
jgi:hypothetical protein